MNSKILFIGVVILILAAIIIQIVMCIKDTINILSVVSVVALVGSIFLLVIMNNMQSVESVDAYLAALQKTTYLTDLNVEEDLTGSTVNDVYNFSDSEDAVQNEQMIEDNYTNTESSDLVNVDDNATNGVIEETDSIESQDYSQDSNTVDNGTSINPQNTDSAAGSNGDTYTETDVYEVQEPSVNALGN